jgi:phosphoglycerol geranylgeranyltransferase
MKTTIIDAVRAVIDSGRRCYWVLLDPDDFSLTDAAHVARESELSGADALLIGGSLLYSNHFDAFVSAVKKAVSIPVILFPGDSAQLSRHADALLYLSLVSGRNPTNLIGEHVKAAPVIRECGIEPIATAYMLVESGSVSSVEFMSNTRPLPRSKPGIAAAHALAAQYMGMSLVYLEAGSGAQLSVPPEMIRLVKKWVEIPVIVGGGIRDVATAREKLDAGADIIVTGTIVTKENGIAAMRAIAETIKSYKSSS